MKSFKKICAIALVLMMILALAACGGSKSGANASGVNTVVSGKLTVATSPDWPPYEFYTIGEDGTPTLAGFDLALAQYIADYMGLELDIIPMDFDGVLNELAAGSVDIGLAGLSPDPERMESMDFSDIYYEGGQSFVTVKDKAGEFTSLDDTNKAELTIGAQNGSIQMDLAEQYSPDADIVALVKATDIVAELLGGKLDGAYLETPVAENFIKNYPDLAIVLDVPYDVEGSSVGVVKGNEALLKAVNEAIAAAKADGSMAKFIEEAQALASGEVYILSDGEIVPN